MERLPPELLSMIFIEGTREREEENLMAKRELLEDERISRTAFPILLSQICSHWRKVALATPALWTTIDFTEADPCPRTLAWLDRSKALLIDIHLLSYEESQAHFQLPILISQTSRWRSFVLEADQHSLFSAFCAKVSARDRFAPFLESVELMSHGQNDGGSLLPLFPADLPKLQSLSLSSVGIQWDETPLLNLKELHFSSNRVEDQPSPERLRSILQKSPTLEVLDLGSLSLDLSWNNHQSRILLPCLMRFSLYGISSLHALSFFQCLIFPSLRSLTLKIYDTDPAETLLFHLAKQACTPNLTSLYLASISCSIGAFIALLRSMPNLNRLSLNLESLPRESLDVLATPLDSTASLSGQPPVSDTEDEEPLWLVPRLYELHLEHFSLPKVRHVVLGRLRAHEESEVVYRIESLVLQGSDMRVSKKDKKWLERLVDDVTVRDLRAF